MADGKKPPQKPSSRATGVDLALIESLLEFMEKHGLEEFEFEREGLRIRLRKHSANLRPVTPSIPAPEIVVARPANASENSAPQVIESAKERPGPAESARSDELHVVKSPIVGTFYNAPAPGAEPFVHTGDYVEQGQVLCIIEAMKLMNEIEADVPGEVVRVMVENGQPVEYGEPLFGILPHRKK